MNGENYLLPVDTDIPQHESDIQLAGLKVDDLVNSIRSETKVVLLDACRDNPALFKNLVKGRGGRSVGLAPTVGSNLLPATTQDAQRPYKYASLEGIVCLAGICRTSSITGSENPVERAKSAEAEEAKIALETRNPEILEAYLQKNPESLLRPELVHAISSLLRSEHDEWTVFGLALPKNLPVYVRINSIEQFGDSVAADIKMVLDQSSTDHPPEGAYQVVRDVFSCKDQILRAAENTIFDERDNILSHYKWAEPEFLEKMVDPTAITPGSVFYFVRNILCDDQLRTPLVQKQQLLTAKFQSIASTPAGDGEIYYKLYRNDLNVGENQVIFIVRFNKDKDPKEAPEFQNLGVTSSIRTTMTLAAMDCTSKRGFNRKIEFYDASGGLIAMVAEDRSKARSWFEIVDKSPMGLVRRIVCHEDETAR